jgi:hypothetical protein
MPDLADIYKRQEFWLVQRLCAIGFIGGRGDFKSLLSLKG